MKKFITALFLLALCFALQTRARADTYVFQAPAGQSSFTDQDGNHYAADANGMVALSSVKYVKNFINSGWTLLATPPVASHNYGAAVVDWTLSTSENAAMVLAATNASGGVNAIATPINGKLFVVYNGSGQTLIIKASGQTGVSIANGVTSMVRGNGTDFVAASLNSSISALDSVVVGGVTPAAGTFTTLGYASGQTASHDYAGAHAAWTMSAAEGRARAFTATDADATAATAILPAGYTGIFFVHNTSGSAVTWKYSASTGISNATGKSQILVADGTEVYSLKSDY